jgi:hypothetical protein
METKIGANSTKIKRFEIHKKIIIISINTATQMPICVYPMSVKSVPDLKQSIESFIKNYFTNASSDIMTQCKASFPHVVFTTLEKNISSY